MSRLKSISQCACRLMLKGTWGDSGDGINFGNLIYNVAHVNSGSLTMLACSLWNADGC